MLKIHERLGDFEIIRLLGKGGMGEVYEARQFNPERRVALKVLAPWLASDDESLQRFLREAKVPANLDHPGIVRIITADCENGVAYYTMHLIRGVSLSEMIRRANAPVHSEAPTKTVDFPHTPEIAPPAERSPAPPSPMPAPDADSNPPVLKGYRHDRFMTVARIGAQAARALAYAHDQGFLHRDIKPSNLMVDHQNYVYLVDFGLTRGMEKSADSTLPGTLIGTPWYMSPEQAEGKPLDSRSDIYSLGVTLYELATQGYGPFTASRDNKQSVLVEVRAGKILPLRTLAPDIPPALEQIILRAMQLKPQKRYESAAQMAKELEAYCGHSGEMSPHPVRKPAQEKHRRRWPIWAACAVAGAVLIVTAAAVAVAMRDRLPWGGAPENVNNVAGKLDGSQAFPVEMRKPAPNTAVLVMSNQHRPLWPLEVYGKGAAIPRERHLGINPFPIYMLGLADPDRARFIFEVDLMPLNITETCDVGVFLGWDRFAKEDNDFLTIKLNRFPIGDAVHGRAIIGTGKIRKGVLVEAPYVHWFKPLALEKSTIVLPPSKFPNYYWPLKINVFGERVTVSVEGRSQTFTLGDVLSDGRVHRDLKTTGTLGIWAKGAEGEEGYFKDAKVTIP